MNVFELFGRLSINKTQAEADLRGVESTAQGSAGRMESFFKKVGGAIAAAFAVRKVADFVQGSVELFSTFEQKMNEVFTLLPGLSDGVKDEMSQSVRDLSVELGVLPNELIPALYQAISAGVPADNVFAFLETAGKTAIGGVTDITTAVNGITSIVNAYGAEVISASEAADIMFTGVRLGKTTIEELSGELFKVAPVAAALGISFGEVTGAMVTMTNQGVPTAQAATYLRGALNELSKDGMEAFAAFEEAAGQTFPEFISAGGSLTDAFALLSDHAGGLGVSVKDLFGSIEGGQGVLMLTGKQAESFSQKVDEMASSAGAAEAAYAEMADTSKQKMNELAAWWESVQITLGGQLMEALTPVFEWLSSNGDRIGSLLGNIFGIIGQVLDLLVKSGLLDLAINLLGGVSSALDMIFDGLFVVVDFIGGAFTSAMHGFEALARSVVDTVTGWVTGLVDTVTGAVDAVKRFFGVSDDLQGVSGKVEDSLKKAADALSKIDERGADANQQLQYFINHMQSAVDNGGDLNQVLALAWQYLDEGKAKYGELSESTKQWVADWIEASYGIKVAAYDVGMSIPEGTAEGIADGTPLVEQAVEDMGDAAIETMQEVTETQSPSRVFMRIGQDLVAGLAQGIRSVLSEIESAARDVVAGLKSGYDSMWSEVESSTKQKWESLVVDVLEGNKTLGDALVSGMDSLVDGMLSSGLDAAATWVSDTLWGMVESANMALGQLALAVVPLMIGTSSAVAQGVANANEQITNALYNAGLINKPYGSGTLKLVDGRWVPVNSPAAVTPSASAAAIADTSATQQSSAAAKGAISVDMRGLYDGAVIHVRDDQDITRIARETHELWASRMRARGYAV